MLHGFSNTHIPVVRRILTTITLTKISSPILLSVRCLHLTLNNCQETDDLIYTSKKTRRRKVYLRLKTLVRNELESSFQERNKTKLKLVDDKLQLKMKYNPKFEGDFIDFGLNKVQTRILKEKFPYIDKPTASQRRIFSVLNSKLSCISRNHQGQGNSMALILYALNYRRPDKAAITTLILVPTKQLVKQYAANFDQMLEGYPYDKSSVVQCIYRDEKGVESSQEKLLREKVPNILVTTPQRLLDLISEHQDDPNWFHLDRIRFIACDEADTLLLPLLNGNGENNNHKHTKLAQLLIDYLNKLRATVVNNPPLQYCFISSIDLTDSLTRLVEDSWCRDRPVLSVGTPVIKSGEIIPRLRIPLDINVGCVVVDDGNEIGPEKDVKLCDVKLNQVLPTGIEAMKKIKSELAIEFDNNYRSYRNKRNNNKKKNLNLEPLSVKLPVQLIKSLGDFLLKSNINNERVLLVIPEGVSTPKLLAQLKLHNLFAQSLDDQNLTDELMSNFFSHSTPKNEQAFTTFEPQFLVGTAANIAGLSFVGLERVICLGVDSVLDSATLIMVASRCRRGDGVSSGLIDETNFVTYFPDSVTESKGANNMSVTLLYSSDQFGILERFALERILLKSGLPYLTPIVGQVEDVDLSKYEKLFEEGENDEEDEELKEMMKL